MVDAFLCAARDFAQLRRQKSDSRKLSRVFGVRRPNPSYAHAAFLRRRMMSAATEKKLRVQPGGHAVHFYRDDAELPAIVGRYLADALAEDATAVVIATEAHMRTFERALAVAEIDVQEARANRSLVFLDAPRAREELLVDGRINRDAFQRVVGRLVRDAGEGGRAVWAYGEVVDLLWQAGDVASAIELEKLWNELIAELDFSLLCAYQSAGVSVPQHVHALREVCELHSSVSSAPRSIGEMHAVSSQLEPDERAPAAARHLLADALRQWGAKGTLVDNARLLISELVTNAVIHARSPVAVSIRSEQSKLRLSVHDKSRIEPTLRPDMRGAQIGGRGLHIVAALSNSWGVEVTADGKTVWAEL